jgi:hypothetical protein
MGFWGEAINGLEYNCAFDISFVDQWRGVYISTPCTAATMDYKHCSNIVIQHNFVSYFATVVPLQHPVVSSVALVLHQAVFGLAAAA